LNVKTILRRAASLVAISALGLFAAIPIAYLVLVATLQIVRPLLG